MGNYKRVKEFSLFLIFIVILIAFDYNIESAKQPKVFKIFFFLKHGHNLNNELLKLALLKEIKIHKTVVFSSCMLKLFVINRSGAKKTADFSKKLSLKAYRFLPRNKFTQKF